MNVNEDHYNHRWIISSKFFEYNLDYKKDLEHYKSILKQIVIPFYEKVIQIERDIKIRKLLNDTKYI